MRAIIISNYGPAENLRIEEIADPQPRPGHVLISVRAFGLNRAELYFRQGLWGDVAKVSGIECAGTVVSDGDKKLAPGQTVVALMGGMGRTINGSYAELVQVPAANVVPIKTTLSFEHLAAIPESYSTAWACLNRNLELATSQTILIRGATSALGQAAINLAVGAGAKVLATTRNQKHFPILAELGAEPVLHEPELRTELTHRGRDTIDAVLDLVGNSTLLDSLSLARPGGRVCLAGFLGGSEPIAKFDPLLHLPSEVHLSFFASAFTFGSADWPLSEVPLQGIVHGVESGLYRSKPARIFSFEEIVAAHTCMENNSAGGKIVVSAPSSTPPEAGKTREKP